MRRLCQLEACPSQHKTRCTFCVHCNQVCSAFQPLSCPALSQAPYVCNACTNQHRCRLNKVYYDALSAHEHYQQHLRDSRSGCSFSEEELKALDEIVTPGLQKKQSLHHIYASRKNEFICSERTLYTLIYDRKLSCQKLDLPRAVRYRPRRTRKSHKVDATCRVGRTYSDYKAYLNEHPDVQPVQMDSVIGSLGGKVLLTLLFTNSDLMLLHLRDKNNAQSVLDYFDDLYKALGRDLFMKLFPVILTDNGSEFSNPRALEFDPLGRRRTRIFYCHPGRPDQKGALEHNHEFIRMVLPKSASFNHLTQAHMDRLASHINALIRKKLNDRTPLSTFSFFFGEDALRVFRLQRIEPEAVTLSRTLLPFPPQEGVTHTHSGLARARDT
ncbi:IS30 family transposase [Oscillospiraceae bacterium HV4-5-C5C]|nr:IS30 family transposase [Oscillospiraceae bacterium HV4-5-C5C]